MLCLFYYIGGPRAPESSVARGGATAGQTIKNTLHRMQRQNENER